MLPLFMHLSLERVSFYILDSGEINSNHGFMSDSVAAAPFILITEPHLLDQVVTGMSDRATILCTFSIGYFLYDLIYLIWNLWGEARTVEYIFHHLTMLTIISGIAWNQTIMPILMLGYLQGNATDRS